MNNEIKIQPSKGNNKVEISNNFAQYFEQLAKKHADDAKESELLAKDWANKLGSTVDDTEYSSKYYALKSKEEHDGAVTDIATAKTELEQSIATGLEDYNTNAQAKSDSLQTQFDTSISNIKKQETTSINAVKTTQTTAESSITELKTSAESSITNGIADIKTNKEQSMSAIDENRKNTLAEIESAKSGAVSSVNETKDNAVTTIKQTGDEEYNKIISTGIDAKANSDLSNLTEAGEKHFLNKSQVTNCILELPQRIKYTLIDGILTILKGSVVIVPYGTEDKTADYPIGAAFLNDNLKVVDTQFAEDSSGVNRFIVWAELQNDTRSFSFPTTGNGQIFCYFKGSEFGFTGLLLDRISSGTISPTETNSQIWFDTNNNLVKEYDNKAFTGKILSFPLGIGTIGANDTWSEISQVFNGVGCIGSTIWADKGVKCLTPNGRNADGSLINEEYTTSRLVMETYKPTINIDALHYLVSEGDEPQDLKKGDIFWSLNTEYIESREMPSNPKDYMLWYDITNNIYKRYYNLKWHVYHLVVFSHEQVTNGKITSFTSKLPFRAVDENEIDGKWVCQSKDLIKYSNNNFPANYNTTFDLSSYLPQDGYKYELIIDSSGNIASYNIISVLAKSSLMYVYLCKIGVSNGTATTHGCGNIIVGQDRKITVSANSSVGTNSISFAIRAYRKVV